MLNLILKNGISLLTIINFLFGDYYISFDFVSKNGILITQNFNCSKAMKNTYGNKKFIFSFSTSYKTVRQICKFQKKQIINNLFRNRIYVYSNNKTVNSLAKTRTKITFLPKRFDIIIKNGTAYFYLKDKKGE